MSLPTPTLQHIEQVSSGWINKYVLTYALPDGGTKVYEAASRKKLDAFRVGLEANAARSAAVLAGRDAPAQPAGPDAVSIVPQTDDGKLVLIREFRYPLNSWCVALPAGLVEPGEALATCVDRELREETGYALRTDLPAHEVLRPLPQAGYSSTGLTDETVHMVFAQVTKAGDAHPEPGELIEPFLLPIANVAQFLQENQLPLGTRAQLALELFAQRKR